MGESGLLRFGDGVGVLSNGLSGAMKNFLTPWDLLGDGKPKARTGGSEKLSSLSLGGVSMSAHTRITDCGSSTGLSIASG